MKFYTVSEAYADYLKGICEKIPNVVDAKYQNPKAFIGIVLEVEGHKYLAPLTSPKDWHANLKPSSPKYFKLHENGNPDNGLGLINLKFMFPIIEDEVSLIDLDELSDTPYKRMLYKQLQFIRSNSERITKKSQLLRKLVLGGEMGGTCDFASLEECYGNYLTQG
ncbi:type III toxin-antitoxin system ToxN/AbiQ family toxin [Vibrio parahaemolyticus]|nr:type III toxin-antitoxin system ToxN/AbiQ family toxin [Vibrio parahaemolyticus]